MIRDLKPLIYNAVIHLSLDSMKNAQVNQPRLIKALMTIDTTAYTSPIGNILQDHELINDIGGTVAAINIQSVFDMT